MRVEILFATMPRWHCIDLILKNLDKAKKPDNTQIAACISGGDDKYINYVEKRLRDIFSRCRIIHNNVPAVEHSDIRTDIKNNAAKIRNIYNVYQLLQMLADNTMDYYWIIEDDTLFPLDTFERLFNGLVGLNADIIAGCSYYWHEYRKRNFWNINKTQIFPANDAAIDRSWAISEMPERNTGYVKIGATGLGNVLMKRECLKSWYPLLEVRLDEGADISFFIHAQKLGYATYGIWDLPLPHITRYENGDMEIIGRIDKSLIGTVL